MKMRKFISVIVLAVYSIVLAHSFVPHHHHSEFTESTQICGLIEHDAHHEHQHELTGDCCIEQEHEENKHTFCSFDDDTPNTIRGSRRS